MPDLKKLDDIKINFIIGAGRSGTTLLVLVLNQSPQCVSTPEIKHFLLFYKKYKNVKIVSQELLDDYLRFYELINASRPIPIFTEKSRSFFLNALKPGDKINYSRLTKLLYLSYFDEKNDVNEITCIVDKNPYYTFHTDKILEIFPDAKFIVMVRDYRAYVLSNRQSQKPFNKVKSVFYYCYAWNWHVKRIISLWNEHKEKILIVKYEEMVSDKEKQIGRIMDFLGLTYSESLFDFYSVIRQRVEAEGLNKEQSERTLKKVLDLSKPINMDRVSAWKTTLTPAEIRKIEYVSAEYGKFFGYEPMARQSPFTKLLDMIASVPGYLRVGTFYTINSPKIHHYLNVVRKAKYQQKVEQIKKNK